MSAQSLPTQPKFISKELVCTKNRKLLKEYGISKGQTVQTVGELLVKYYDGIMKQVRYIKLSRKLMKYFK